MHGEILATFTQESYMKGLNFATDFLLNMSYSRIRFQRQKIILIITRNFFNRQFEWISLIKPIHHLWVRKKFMKVLETKKINKTKKKNKSR